ncbi:MAG: PD40 domain-containing protein [Alistipes sp.]|nr:PD40 domain-containing protein [Candidatus Minthomonas equi]
MKIRIYFTFVLACTLAFPASVRGQGDTFNRANQLHREYRFEEAAELYRKAAELTTDSTELFKIQQASMLNDNGINFLLYASKPHTNAKKNVPVTEFPLWIPALSGEWVSIPNVLVSQKSDVQNCTFFGKGDVMVYSAQGAGGDFDIFSITREEGTQWSAPEPIEGINTSGDEIHPFVSADGSTMWFASNGHPGIGGYDVFVSRWDEDTKAWGTPENLGFPYSSTADDIFYCDTPGGNWTVLVSTRNAGNGTTDIYVMEFDSNPIKTSISDLSEIQKIARLEPADSPSPVKETKTSAKVQEDSQTAGYIAAVTGMRDIQKSYQDMLSSLNARRADYERASSQEQSRTISKEITSLEIQSSQTKEKLDAATEAVKKAEMELLKKGIIPPEVNVQKEHPAEQHQPSPSFHFSRNEPASAPEMTTRIPEPVFNYTFRIQEETEFAPEEVISEGIIYQIRMAVLSSYPTAARFKGITPVFVRKSGSQFICSAGAFRSYEEATKAVSKVKAKGFSQAFLTAYKDGKGIKVQTARLEQKADAGQSYNVTLNGYPDGLPSAAKTIISSTCTKDLAKSIEEDQIIYIVGPFSSRSEAETLVTALEAAGIEGVSMETVSK